jgi:hypothetical protein
MITIDNGLIYVNGEQTTDANLIGLAMLDFAEQTQGDNHSITLTDGDVFIDLVIEATKP